MVDLASIEPNDRTIEITHPGTGENIGVRVTVMSANDVRMQKTRRQLTDKRLSDHQKNKALTSEQAEENGNRLIFAAMTGWEWYDDASFNGEIPAFNRLNVFAVFSKLPWFREQLDTAIADDEAFFTESKSL